MLDRIPKMEAAPGRQWREVMFLGDEYHAFATVGESDPSGDEKFFSLSRQARCIPIIATQSISSLRSALPGDAWRTLLQTFRDKHSSRSPTFLHERRRRAVRQGRAAQGAVQHRREQR